MILVTLGTQDKPFVRLLEAVEKQIENGTIQEEVIAQVGSTKYTSHRMQIIPYIPEENFSHMLEKANLLLLDEPTNHLDPETQSIIGDNFKDYKGTIILVSHNASFVEKIGIDRMLILPSGKITNYNEDLLNYYYQLNEKKNH